MKPAIFLDRDGVVTIEKGFVCSVDDLEIFSFAKKCVECLQIKGYWVIVITNQSAVGRGLLEVEELEKMNRLLIDEIGVDAVYYCPHFHEDSPCECRKPEIGLIKQALKDFAIDMTKSWFVGDRASDILAGEACGVRTVLLNSGYGIMKLEKSVSPDYIYENLMEFVENLDEKLF